MTWQRTGGAGSPFELMASRTTGSRRLPKVPTYERMAHSDPGAKRTAGNPLRVRLPFEFDREDIPFVPARSVTADAQAAALMFSTRMTAVEQARTRQDDVQRSAPTTMEGCLGLRTMLCSSSAFVMASERWRRSRIEEWKPAAN